jgi:creatinine amidohydrolase
VSATGIVGTLRRDLIRPEVGAELLRFIIDDLIGQLRTYYPGLLS